MAKKQGKFGKVISYFLMLFILVGAIGFLAFHERLAEAGILWGRGELRLLGCADLGAAELPAQRLGSCQKHCVLDRQCLGRSLVYCESTALCGGAFVLFLGNQGAYAPERSMIRRVSQM